jgi:hypothetical protein
MEVSLSCSDEILKTRTRWRNERVAIDGFAFRETIGGKTPDGLE